MLLNASKWRHTAETWADVLLFIHSTMQVFFPGIFFYYFPNLTMDKMTIGACVCEKCRTKWQIHKGLPLITQLYSSPELWGALESFQFILFVSVFIFLSPPLSKNLIPMIPSYFTKLF